MCLVARNTKGCAQRLVSWATDSIDLAIGTARLAIGSGHMLKLAPKYAPLRSVTALTTSDKEQSPNVGGRPGDGHIVSKLEFIRKRFYSSAMNDCPSIPAMPTTVCEAQAAVHLLG